MDWKDFCRIIKVDVKEFHAGIARKYHVNTYVFYGSDPRQKAWGNAVWRGGPAFLINREPYDPSNNRAPGIVVRNTGKRQRLVSRSPENHPALAEYWLDGPDENGDGTVPWRSGGSPKGHVKVCIPYKNIEHEKAFQGSLQMRFSLWAVTKIAYSVKNTKMAY